MRRRSISYSVITTTRDDEKGLARLSACLLAQGVLPIAWMIVDSGSRDGTPAIAKELANKIGFVKTLGVPGPETPTRGAPIARAFSTGIAVLERRSDLVAKVDADVSFDAHFFERILNAFADEPSLGIASGRCYEPARNGRWRESRVSGRSVHAQCRVYRRACLDEILPFEQRMMWDGLDQIQANAAGWSTRVVADAFYRHHRPIGQRDRSRLSTWFDEGASAHYVGYRPHYVALKGVVRAPRDPSSIGFVAGYVAAATRRRPRHRSASILAEVRRQQSALVLARRLRDALGGSR
jgi:poly-beta-1,6-N-acetyl-D-glucosamine synthase